LYDDLTAQEKAQMKQFGIQDLLEMYIETNFDKKKQFVDRILSGVRKTVKLLQPFGLALDTLATGSGLPSQSFWFLMKLMIEVRGPQGACLMSSNDGLPFDI
jgi:hypothetical protein